MQSGLKEKGFNIGKTESPVTPVLLNGSTEEASQMIMDMRENYGIFCSVVVYPVVPKGIMILRLIPTAVHTLAQVDQTIKAFEEVAQKLKKGTYSNTYANTNL